MAIATINLFSVTDPAGGYLQETTSEKSVDIATCKDATGITKLAVPIGVVTETITLKGKGTYAPSVTRNLSVGATAVITSGKASESNDDFPDYEVTLQKFSAT